MNNYKNYDELPLTLTADDLSKFLGISKGSCYSMFKRDDFPTIKSVNMFLFLVTVLFNGLKTIPGRFNL